ncbi:MAG: type II toxin-antitoxin system HigB family toxin [Hyphomicrobiales bacterium]|nr:type II toxin-antitoxin system HigB family toxin [Hyphomicrobiales bacterium]
MRIVARKSLVEFWKAHPETKSSLARWYEVTASGNWSSLSDVVATFPRAKALGRDRVRFEVAGGNYRLIVAYRFDVKIAWVKFIGTHSEYDKVDATTISIF